MGLHTVAWSLIVSIACCLGNDLTSSFSLHVAGQRNDSGHWVVFMDAHQVSARDSSKDMTIDVEQFITSSEDSEIVEWVSTASFDPHQDGDCSSPTHKACIQETMSEYQTATAVSQEATTDMGNLVYHESTTDYLHRTTVAVGTSTVTTQNVPTVQVMNGYEKFPNVGWIKVYKNKSVTWDEANTTCVNEGAHLMFVDSDRKAAVFEKLYLQNWVKASSTTGKYYVIHAGFHDRFRKGKYITVLGTPVDDSRWAPGHPTSVEGNCGSSRFDGMMYMTRCTFHTFFFCEKSLISFSSTKH